MGLVATDGYAVAIEGYPVADPRGAILPGI